MNTFDAQFSSLKLPLYGVRLPEFNVEESQKIKYGLPKTASNYDFLIQVCRNNFKKLRIPKEDYPKYSERIKYEFETIKEQIGRAHV